MTHRELGRSDHLSDATTGPARALQVEQAFRWVDDGRATGTTDDEDHRNQQSVVEFQNVVGRVVDDGDADASLDTLLVDDACANQLVHPQCIVVVSIEGFRQKDGIGQLLGRSPVGDSVEANQPTLLLLTRLHHGEPLRAGEEACAWCKPLDTVGDQRNVQFAMYTVGAADAPDFA